MNTKTAILLGSIPGEDVVSIALLGLVLVLSAVLGLALLNRKRGAPDMPTKRSFRRPTQGDEDLAAWVNGDDTGHQ